MVSGQQVVLRGPRQRRAGGRAIYRQPLTDPCVVTGNKGNKLSVRRPDGTEVHDVHLEDVILVPESVRSLESKEPLVFVSKQNQDSNHGYKIATQGQLT